MKCNDDHFSCVDVIERSCSAVDHARKTLKFTFTRKERKKCLLTVLNAWKDTINALSRSSVSRFSDRSTSGSYSKPDDIPAIALQWTLSLAAFFSQWLLSSRSREQIDLLGESGVRTARRLARCYAPALTPYLLQESTLISEQIRSLTDLSLSAVMPAFPSGEVRLLLQSDSRERRERAWHTLVSRIDDGRDTMAMRYVELHALRRSMTESAGYKHYGEYAVRRYRLSDTFRTHVPAFRDAVRRYITPLIAPIQALHKKRLELDDIKPWDLLYPANFGPPCLHMEEESLEKTWINIMRQLLTTRVPQFEKMSREEMIKLNVLNAERSPVVFGETPNVVVAPFIEPSNLCFALSNIPQEYFAHTLFFMSGALMLDPLASDSVSCELFSVLERALSEQDDRKSVDYALPVASAPPTFLTACIAGYSFSFLSQRAWRHYYGPMADYAEQYLVTAFAFELLFLSALDEMDDYLASATVSDAAAFERTWVEIAERYALPGIDSTSPGLLPVRDLWLMAPSFLNKPLTGIVRALALITVLGTLPFGRNHIQLEEYYVRLLNTREGSNPLLRPLRSGFPSPFKEETVQKAAFAIADFLAL